MASRVPGSIQFWPPPTLYQRSALLPIFPRARKLLGYAIIEEVVANFPRDRWLLPLERSKDKDPIDVLIGIVRAILQLGQRDS